MNFLHEVDRRQRPLAQIRQLDDLPDSRFLPNVGKPGCHHSDGDERNQSRRDFFITQWIFRPSR